MYFFGLALFTLLFRSGANGCDIGQDVQLKILQALPSLLQNYASQLTNVLLATALHICFLLHASKTAVVSNTAAATLQQAVVSVLGKVGREDGLYFPLNSGLLNEPVLIRYQSVPMIQITLRRYL